MIGCVTSGTNDLERAAAFDDPMFGEVEAGAPSKPRARDTAP